MKYLDAESIYCLVCNTVQHVTQAEVIFRTGYYRIDTPLGCCKACRTLWKPMDMSLSLVEHEMPEYGDLTLDGSQKIPVII